MHLNWKELLVGGPFTFSMVRKDYFPTNFLFCSQLTISQFHCPPSLFPQYNVIRRIRETNLLGKTAETGILSKLENNGVDLETLESLLPLAEKLGALSLVANNQQLLLNGVAPLLVEPAPFLLPLIAGALEVGPAAFFALSAGLLGLEGVLVTQGVEIPFVGLSAGFYLGLLLVPLAGISAAAGAALNAAGSKQA